MSEVCCNGGNSARTNWTSLKTIYYYYYFVSRLTVHGTVVSWYIFRLLWGHGSNTYYRPLSDNLLKQIWNVVNVIYGKVCRSMIQPIPRGWSIIRGVNIKADDMPNKLLYTYISSCYTICVEHHRLHCLYFLVTNGRLFQVISSSGVSLLICLSDVNVIAGEYSLAVREFPNAKFLAN